MSMHFRRRALDEDRERFLVRDEEGDSRANTIFPDLRPTETDRPRERVRLCGRAHAPAMGPIQIRFGNLRPNGTSGNA